MKRTGAAFAAICMSLTIVSCTNSKKAGTVSTEAIQGAEWKVTYQSTCRLAEARDCVAAHGFTVTSDAKYRVGAAGGSGAIEGELTPAEFQGLKAALEPALGNIVNAPGVLETVATRDGEAADNDDSVHLLHRNGREVTLISALGDEFRYSLSAREQADALHARLQALAERYYPTGPVGNCNAAIQQLHDSYKPVRACGMDADCAFVTDGFAPIERGTNEWITTDDGLNYNLLVVANAASLARDQESLTAARDAVYKSCTYREGFDGSPRGVYSEQARPACVKNVCQAPAGFSY